MICAIRRRLARPRDDSGSAMVEFVLLVGPLFIPLVYLVVAAFEVQRTAFAVSEGARQAGRAYVTASNARDAKQRAIFAANLALVDQGLPRLAREDDFQASGPGGTPATVCRGRTITVTVKARSSLPFLPEKFGTIPVSASHTEAVDDLRDLPAC